VLQEKSRGGMGQLVVGGWRPVKGSRCFLEQETSASLLSTGW